MKLSAILVCLSCIGVLGGCANPRLLVVGQSTEADVRARLGNPTDTRVDRNGDRLWDYASGPEGVETHRVRIGADGKVKEVTQLLREDQLEKVVPGKMTQADVRDLLGRPSDESTYSVGLTWSWRFKRVGVQPGYLVVSFNPDGTVKDKIVIIDPSGDAPQD
jgi:outer membrane protein assembly factor BamE (lipoprotein component of BamABCDE complex)